MRKFKFCVVVLVIVSMMLTFVACGGSDSSSSSSSDSSSSSSTKSDEKDVDDSQKKGEFTIKLGHSDKPIKEAIIHYTAEVFKELVEKETNGRVLVEIYPSNQLGDQTEMVNNTQTGVQEMFQGSVGNLAQAVPAMNYMVFPYLFTSKDNARDTIDAMWDKNSEWIIEAANIRPLIWTDAGFRNLTSSKKPIKVIEDLKGQRIRVPNNPISVATFKAFGIDPTVLAWSETFNALQQGVVDGQENCYSSVQTERFFETQKYATDIEWQYTISHFSISEEVFQKYPKEIQEAIIKCGKEATAKEREQMDTMEEEIQSALEKEGVEFYGRPDDFDKWVEYGRSVWPQFYELLGNGDAAKGEEVINTVLGK